MKNESAGCGTVGGKRIGRWLRHNVYAHSVVNRVFQAKIVAIAVLISQGLICSRPLQGQARGVECPSDTHL
jgi:hypothetical protein